jgi:hypothetical protein
MVLATQWVAVIAKIPTELNFLTVGESLKARPP